MDGSLGRFLSVWDVNAFIAVNLTLADSFHLWIFPGEESDAFPSSNKNLSAGHGGLAVLSVAP